MCHVSRTGWQAPVELHWEAPFLPLQPPGAPDPSAQHGVRTCPSPRFCPAPCYIPAASSGLTSRGQLRRQHHREASIMLAARMARMEEAERRFERARALRREIAQERQNEAEQQQQQQQVQRLLRPQPHPVPRSPQSRPPALPPPAQQHTWQVAAGLDCSARMRRAAALPQGTAATSSAWRTGGVLDMGGIGQRGRTPMVLGQRLLPAARAGGAGGNEGAPSVAARPTAVAVAAAAARSARCDVVSSSHVTAGAAQRASVTQPHHSQQQRQQPRAATEWPDARPAPKLHHQAVLRQGGLTFRSNFDSGNLGAVRELEPDAMCEGVCDLQFELWTTPDCFGTAHETANRSWFHFSVAGLPGPGTTLRLRVREAFLL
jgi:hypothetical protein